MTSTGGSQNPTLGLMFVGTVLVVSIVLGYFLGTWIDRKIGSSPWGLIIGVLLGTTVGFLELFRIVRRTLK